MDTVTLISLYCYTFLAPLTERVRQRTQCDNNDLCHHPSTFIFQSSSLTTLGQFKVRLVRMHIWWSFTKVYIIFSIGNLKCRNKSPQCVKKSIFCMWYIYFSTNFDNFFVYVPYIRSLHDSLYIICQHILYGSYYFQDIRGVKMRSTSKF